MSFTTFWWRDFQRWRSRLLASPRSDPAHLRTVIAREYLYAALYETLLVALTGFLVPMPLMVVEVLIGLLQAYIFAVLATVYVGAAIRVGEE